MSSYTQENNEVPSDNSYISRKGEPQAVVSDETKVEDPISANTADSDAQLGTSTQSRHHLNPSTRDTARLTCTTDRDDKEAINEDNIIDKRTRGAKPQAGYQEPGDTDRLPENSGRSAVAQ